MERIRILQVEDDDVDAETIRRHLRTKSGLDIELCRATSLDAAIQETRGSTYDLMLLDLGLPDRSGRETLIYARAGAPRVPIVVLTGADDEGQALWALKNGAQDYLIKESLTRTSLLRAARFALERNHLLARIGAYADEARAAENQLRQKVAALGDSLDRLRGALAPLGVAGEGAQCELDRIAGIIGTLDAPGGSPPQGVDRPT